MYQVTITARGAGDTFVARRFETELMAQAWAEGFFNYRRPQKDVCPYEDDVQPNSWVRTEDPDYLTSEWDDPACPDLLLAVEVEERPEN